MTSQSKFAETGDEKPSKANMWPCGTTRMQSDSKDVSDGINGTLPIPDRILNAMKVGPGEPVRVLVEANGKWTTAIRDIYSNGLGVTLPVNKRRSLDLQPGDEVEYWVEPHEDESKSTNTGSKSNTVKSETDVDKQVLIFPGNTTYHYVASEDAEKTICGVDLKERNYSLGTDPGDLLQACENCENLTSSDLTNMELAEWLADEVGFEINSDNVPSYFNNHQMTMIRNHIVGLKQNVDEGSK